MCATLSIAKIDMEWADNQYWSTLFAVIREKTSMLMPKQVKKEKMSATQMQNFIR